MANRTEAGVLKGSKVSNKHSTYIEVAAILIRTAKTDTAVTRVILSQIDPIRGTARRLRLWPIQAGLKIRVYGPAVVQTLFVYTSEPLRVRQALIQAWQKEWPDGIVN